MRRLIDPVSNSRFRSSRRGSASPVLLAAIAMILLVVLGGAYYLRSKGPNPVRLPNRNVILRIHGSNTIGSELGPALVVAYLKRIGATNIKTAPQQKEELEIQADIPGETSPAIIEVQAHGSATAFKDLIAGRADVGMASRKIEQSAKNDEVTAARTAGLGDLTLAASEHVIGLDGVAVIVNSDNPVRSLTTQQIAQIFAGEIADWSGVQGKTGPIRLFARDENSGTWDTFRNLVLKDRKLAGSATRLEDSKELSDRVAADEGAIGFTGLPYIQRSRALAVFETQSNGGNTSPLMPTIFSVRTEEYPLSRRLYFYNPERPSTWAKKFTDFALSAEGQVVVADNKFVSLTPCTGCEGTPRPSGVSDRYRKLTEGRERISLNFFFRSGSAVLDTRAAADIDRVLDLLRDLHYSGSGVVLMGFADNSGDPQVNRVLSGKRAQVVADEFVLRGIHPQSVEPFGSEMPIASNDSATGKEKNRRVEIWVKRD